MRRIFVLAALLVLASLALAGCASEAVVSTSAGRSFNLAFSKVVIDTAWSAKIDFSANKRAFLATKMEQALIAHDADRKPEAPELHLCLSGLSATYLDGTLVISETPYEAIIGKARLSGTTEEICIRLVRDIVSENSTSIRRRR